MSFPKKVINKGAKPWMSAPLGTAVTAGACAALWVLCATHILHKEPVSPGSLWAPPILCGPSPAGVQAALWDMLGIPAGQGLHLVGLPSNPGSLPLSCRAWCPAGPPPPPWRSLCEPQPKLKTTVSSNPCVVLWAKAPTEKNPSVFLTGSVGIQLAAHIASSRHSTAWPVPTGNRSWI